MKVYIAGPMSGYPESNFPAFFRAEEYLNTYKALITPELKITIFNPAQMDIDAGFDPRKELEEDQKPTKEQCKEFAKRDTETILQCDAIYMLRGWENSVGARAEHALAVWLQLEIWYERNV